MSVLVSLNAQRRDPAFLYGSFGQSAGRDVDLNDAAFHFP
jgi:hypothetical protein